MKLNNCSKNNIGDVSRLILQYKNVEIKNIYIDAISDQMKISAYKLR